MNSPEPLSDANHASQRLRLLRPLLWWLLLVIALVGYTMHQRLSKETRLHFAFVFAGQQAFEASAKLDGKAIMNGEQVSIGQHNLVVWHPKARLISTNFFIWYHGRDLGVIELTRSTGILAIAVSPPAKTLTISGPEFSKTYYNSQGMTSSVPTDRYIIEAQYDHWQTNVAETVVTDATARRFIAPRFGALRIESNISGATFELNDQQKHSVEKGVVPCCILDLVEGYYALAVSFHANHQESAIKVTAAETNTVKMEFVFGAAWLDTQPEGAAVAARRRTGLNKPLKGTVTKVCT